MKNYKWDPNKIWERHFGSSVSTFDFANRRIRKSEYNTDSPYAWNIDHICPISEGGTDSIKNLIPVHKETNKEKSYNFPSFVSNGEMFRVYKSKNSLVSDWEIRFDTETNNPRK